MSATLLNIGSRALGAAQASLATVSHNIANANTAGYSRQEAVLSTANAQFTGAGWLGRGVDVASVRRHYDQFLTAAVQASGSTSAADAARAQGLQALDRVFADSELGIGAALDDFFAAAGDLANRPADLSARQVFVARAGELAQRISGVGSQIRSLAREADGRLTGDASLVNQRLTEIARLNARITEAQGTGQPPNDLLDQRDAAVQALGQLMSVQVVRQDDGGLNLFTVEGAALLVGQQQARLTAEADPLDASRSALRLSVNGVSQWLDAAAIGGGSLAGTLRLRDEDLAAALNQVGRIAQVVGAAVNAQQAVGIDMDGQPGAAMFNVPGPSTIAATGNGGSVGVAASITNATLLQPSDYEVRWDGAAWQITRVADGHTQSAASLPTSIDGLEFQAGGTPATGDRWLVRPFSDAATSIAARNISPRAVATALAGAAQPAADNRNALALAGLASAGLAAGATLNESYASLLGDVGSRVQIARASADISARLQDEAVSRQQQVAGVDLDEEAANLLRYQQAYQASARIIQAGQSLFESLLAATGR